LHNRHENLHKSLLWLTSYIQELFPLTVFSPFSSSCFVDQEARRISQPFKFSYYLTPQSRVPLTLSWNIYSLVDPELNAHEITRKKLYTLKFLNIIQLLNSVILVIKYYLTLNLLMWRIWWAPNNASKWQVGFNSAFKELATHHAQGTQ